MCKIRECVVCVCVVVNKFTRLYGYHKHRTGTIFVTVSTDGNALARFRCGIPTVWATVHQKIRDSCGYEQSYLRVP